MILRSHEMERIQKRGKLEEKGKRELWEKKGAGKFPQSLYQTKQQIDDPKALLRITARPI